MFKIGKYQHFKGNFYQVFHLAKHSETEEVMVVYQPLYNDKLTKNNDNNSKEFWVRPLSMFDETIERDGKTIKRFTFIGEM